MEHDIKIRNIFHSLSEAKKIRVKNTFVLFFLYGGDNLNYMESSLDEKSYYILLEHNGTIECNDSLFIGQKDGDFGVIDVNNKFIKLSYLDTALSNQLALFMHKELISNLGKINNSSLLIGFANYILRLYFEQKHFSNNLKMGITPFQLSRIKDFVEKNMEETINISLLAKTCNLSLHHFMRMFKRTTGETPHQYVNRLKMEQAKLLLRGTKQAIIQVGMEVGINNASHFSQLFKTKYGISPLRYRKTVQDNSLIA